MNVQSCESPVRIYDKFRKKHFFVPCGKCNTCRNIKNNTWVDRLIQESQCWPYTVFFTLTFDERHLPTFELDSNGFLCDPHSGECVDLNEIVDFRHLTPVAKRLYVHKRKSIPYVTVDVAQRFIKRLRYYFTTINLHTHEQNILRYFIVSEYGPSTYRPHLHGLLFFSSKLCADRFEEVICKAWKVGGYDWSFVRDSAASYVARYVDSVQSLPRIYLHKRIRPFLICSKQPPIGTLQVSSEEVKEIFLSGAVKRTIHDYKRLSFKDVPLWRSLKDRLFPKIQLFDVFSHQERVTLYGVYRYSKSESFDDFLSWVEKLFKFSYSPGCFCETFLSRHLLYLYQLDSISSNPGKFYALRNLYYVSRRVYMQRVIFGVSLDLYVTKIEDYYSNVELQLLNEFYKFQEDYVQIHLDSRPLIYLYGDYAFTFSSHNSLYHNFSLVSFGYVLDDTLSSQLMSAFGEYRVEYDLMVKKNYRIFRQSMKTKKKNDYLNWIENNEYYRKRFTFNFYKDYA